MRRDEAFRATVYPMNMLLIKKGVHFGRIRATFLRARDQLQEVFFGKNGLGGCFFRSFLPPRFLVQACAFAKSRGPRSVRNLPPSTQSRPRGTIGLGSFRVHDVDKLRELFASTSELIYQTLDCVVPQKKRRDPPLGGRAAIVLC